MPKEVRLNDKLWFGKYKGKTIKTIVDCDMRFLETLMSQEKITFHKNVNDYISGDSRMPKYKSPPSYGYGHRGWSNEWESGSYTSYVDPPQPTSPLSEDDRRYVEERIRELGLEVGRREEDRQSDGGTENDSSTTQEAV